MKHYKSIFITFLKYLPSRLLVVLNAMIIVPVLAHMLSVNEIAIFQLAIGILNLVCTCSTDWIAKSVLRFYEHYKIKDNLDAFFSNTIFITIIVYFVIILAYLLFADTLSVKFLIPKNVLFLTMLLVIPTGFRQFLYQMLRIFNKPFLYSFSIVFYQISMLILFLFLAGFMPNVFAVLSAMAISLLILDGYLVYELKLRIKLKFEIDKGIMFESLKYALPQVITNTSVWAILNLNRFVSQWLGFYDLTAVIGVSYMLVSSILTPIFSVFIFALFPSFIRRYEKNADIKTFLTGSIRLYAVMFLPIATLFCYFSKEITNILFSVKYPQAYITVAFFAIGIFFHEMMKLFNMKYHLVNKTYIEMLMGIFVGCVSIVFTYFMIKNFGALGAGIAMLSAILFLIILNSIVKVGRINYVKYSSVLYTLALTAIISLCAYVFCRLLFIPVSSAFFSLIKMAIYLFISYGLSIIFVHKLLE